MKYDSYQTSKRQFDDAAMAYIAKRIFTNIEDSDAYKSGIVDSVGNMKKKSNGWEFTNLDRFVLALKQQVGEENLRSLLDVYAKHSDMDDLRLIKSIDKPIPQTFLPVMQEIVSIFNGTAITDSYRPDILIDTDETLGERITWTLTVATFLLYTMKLGRIPTSIEFKSNVIPSVEVTFYCRANIDYSGICEYVKSTALVDDNEKLTSKAIKAMVSAGAKMMSGNLLSVDGSRIEDQSKSWERLGNKHNGSW